MGGQVYAQIPDRRSKSEVTVTSRNLEAFLSSHWLGVRAVVLRTGLLYVGERGTNFCWHPEL